MFVIIAFGGVCTCDYGISWSYFHVLLLWMQTLQFLFIIMLMLVDTFFFGIIAVEISLKEQWSLVQQYKHIIFSYTGKIVASDIVFWLSYCFKNSEYDQETPQSQTIVINHDWV